MHVFKRKILVMFASMMCISGSVVTYAQSNTDVLQNIQQELNQKNKEKQSVNNEIKGIQKEIDSINQYIFENKKAMDLTQKRIDEMNQLIEKKKEEIVILEDKILGRKEVMKKRLVALQHDNNLNIAIKVLIEAKDFDDFLQRANAVTALLSADKDIMDAQQEDLRLIEVAKKEIDRQQQLLQEEQKVLAGQQAELNSNLQKRQETLTVLQEKFSQINDESADIQSQLNAVQEKIRIEQETANRIAAQNGTSKSAGQAPSGTELYVSASAYSPEESGAYTKLGYNIQANPYMKLIAVDPSVIPLGKRVWVEGYGEAIAGDVGSAIKGHKIDVLMPTKEAALSWGRRVVKIVILD
jgi:peptidoglycan hydrolase CwlO-like protein